MTPIQQSRAGDAIIIGGARVYCAAPVVLWQESGLAFTGRPRRKQTRVVTLHWTAGEGDAKQVHRTLTEAGSSVPFFVDAAGLIWQFCDADRRTVHCPGWNSTGVGIEIQNRGTALTVPLPKGVTRALVHEDIHGREVVYSDFTAPQIVSVMTLVRAVCGHYHLPVQVPVDRRGQVITGVLSTLEAARFTGVCGHYQAPGTTKNDPGPRILRLIHDQEGDNA